MIKPLYFIHFIFSSLYFMPILAQENGWELKKEEDGIKVFFKESDQSKIKELRITFSVKSSLNTMIAVLKDIEAFPEWIFKCEEARMVEKISEKELYYYSTMNFPWPLTDRDAISYSTFRQDPVTKTIYTENIAAPAKEPERKDMVRIETMEIRWKIVPKKDGTVLVDYFLLSDPGGSIPAWLINFAIDRGPVQSMKAFREMLNLEKYQTIAQKYVEELNVQ